MREDSGKDSETLIRITKAVLKRRNMVPIKKYEDYYFEGILEGLKAVDTYDSTKDSKFTTYLFLKINYRIGTILRANKAQKRNNSNNIMLENTLLEETGVINNQEYIQHNRLEDELSEQEFKDNFHKILKEELNFNEYEYLCLVLKGYKIKEIADILNITSKQASNKLYYIREKLKKKKVKFENL